MIRSGASKVVSIARAAENKQKRRPASRRLALLTALLLSVATLLATATVALAVVFANTTSITIPSSGSAAPYPSPIAVSGLTGTISDVNVDLRGLSHPWPDDVAVLLVGPGGQSVILMSDAGGGDITCGGGGPVNNVNLTFDDQAAQQLPDGSQISSGTYRPIQGSTNAGCGNPRPSTFPAPAPSGPYGTTLSVFNGASPNGTYSLYVFDDTTPDGGSISGGWNLDILTRTTSDTTAPKVNRVVPAENATGVAPGANVSAIFSEAMRASSINTNTVKLFKAGTTTPLGAGVSYDAERKKAVLNPNANLQLGKKYKAVVTVGTRDLAGNQLDQNPSLTGNQPKVWFFTVRN